MPLFAVVTEFGGIVAVVVLALILILFKQRLHGVRILLLAAISFSAVFVAKLIFERPRPDLLLVEVTQRGLYQSDYGFPSGHTAVAAAVGIGLLAVLPRRFRWLVITIILLVGISRIYLGVHAPLDVVAGLAIGTSIALLYFLFSSSGAIRQKYFSRSKLRRAKT
jgi:undecaprenyl-diphosphatase